MDTWKCTDCKITKPKTEFGPHKSCKKGHQSYCRKCSQSRKRASKYKISLKKYKELKSTPCEICKELKISRLMAIDHCHKSGEVRGSLCTKCNSGIGMFNDSIELLMSACEYLIEKSD